MKCSAIYTPPSYNPAALIKIKATSKMYMFRTGSPSTIVSFSLSFFFLNTNKYTYTKVPVTSILCNEQFLNLLPPLQVVTKLSHNQPEQEPEKHNQRQQTNRAPFCWFDLHTEKSQTCQKPAPLLHAPIRSGEPHFPLFIDYLCHNHSGNAAVWVCVCLSPPMHLEKEKKRGREKLCVGKGRNKIKTNGTANEDN